jgi:hypothetical protein
MRTLRGDGHDHEEIASLTDRSLRTVMKHLDDPGSVEYLAFKVREITDAADGALGAAAMTAVEQLIACLYEAEPKDKPAIAAKILSHWETIQKIRKDQNSRLVAEHVKIERTMGHPLDKPENMTEAERMAVIKRTAFGDKSE